MKTEYRKLGDPSYRVHVEGRSEILSSIRTDAKRLCRELIGVYIRKCKPTNISNIERFSDNFAKSIANEVSKFALDPSFQDIKKDAIVRQQIVYR